MALLLVTVTTAAVTSMVGHSAAEANTYPWSSAVDVNPSNYDWGYSTCPASAPNCKTYVVYKNGVAYGVYDPWNYYFRNCTSFVAHRVAQEFAGRSVAGWGNAITWDENAVTAGYTKNGTPQVGDIVQWDTGAYGHVAYVYAVNGTVASIAEYNQQGTGLYSSHRTVNANAAGVDFIHMGTPSGGGGSTVTPPTWKMTSSTENAPFGGDFNGDGYGDAIVLHKNPTNNGGNIHLLYGNPGSSLFQYNPTSVKTLPTGWDYTKIKFLVGKFNDDQYSDIAIFHQRPDGGANVHMFYGSSGTPLQAWDDRRYMEGSQGWVWSEMKLVSGDFTGDGRDDVMVGAKRSSDGGMGLHVLTGGVGGLVLNNVDTSWRNLPGPSWLWANMKLAAGPFNGDNNADLVVVYNNAGINMHIFNGGPEKFNNATTQMRTLPASSGWIWADTKLAAGQFNDDLYADIAMFHKWSGSDVGANIHPFYGSGTSAPFQGSTDPIRTLAPSNNWNWHDMKLVAGPFQGDNWNDIAVLHKRPTVDTEVHVLYGNPGTQMFNYNPTSVRWLPNSNGWNWFDIKL